MGSVFGIHFDDDEQEDNDILEGTYRTFTMFFACRPSVLESNKENTAKFINEGIDNILQNIVDKNNAGSIVNSGSNGVVVDDYNVFMHLDGLTRTPWEVFEDNKEDIINALVNGTATPTKVGVEANGPEDTIDETDGLVVLQIKFKMSISGSVLTQKKTTQRIFRHINFISQKLDDCIDKYPCVEDVALLFDKTPHDNYDMNNEETRIKFIEQSLILMDNGKPILYPNNKKALFAVLFDDIQMTDYNDNEDTESNIEVDDPSTRDERFANVANEIRKGTKLAYDDNDNLFITDNKPVCEVKHIDGKYAYLIPTKHYPYPNIKGCVAETPEPTSVNIKWICQNKKDFTDEIDKASEEQKFTKLLHLVAERANKREYFNSTTSASILQAFEEDNVAFNGNNKYYPSGLLALIQYNINVAYAEGDWQLPTRDMAKNMFGNSDNYYCVEDVFDFPSPEITSPTYKTLVPVLIRKMN